MAGTGYTVPASAETASDCRQEALEYGISTEELDDYIDGCLASRGESMTDEADSTDYVPPVESDDLTDPPRDDSDAP